MVHDVVEQHCDLVQKMNKDLLLEADEADQSLREMLAIGAQYGCEGLPELPVMGTEVAKMLEKERKKKKKMASIYDIAEDDREGSENSNDEELEKDAKQSEDSQAVAIPYPSILTKDFAELNHTEAEEELGGALAIMMEQIREQTDNLAELFAIEESKVSNGTKSSTKRSTYAPSDSMSMYGPTQSVMSTSSAIPKTAKALKFDTKNDAKEERKLDKLAAEAQAFLLSNQKKVISDSGSVASTIKGTVIGEETKSVKSMRKPGLNSKSNISVGGTATKTSFSKAGKAMNSKYL